MINRRWEPCVHNRGCDAENFLKVYFSQPGRNLLVVAGAGFDPRSIRVAKLLPASIQPKLDAVLIREERPNPDSSLIELAEANRDKMVESFPRATEHAVHIFANDNAVIGGREAAKLVASLSIESYTDVLVDTSALSIGVAFPVVKTLLQLAANASGHVCNIHVIASHNRETDESVSSNPSDTPTAIHGFRGNWALSEKSRAAMLWMPQLGRGKGPVLGRIFQMLRNVQEDTVVCPILPFPSSRPRLPDELIVEFAEELQSSWSVDARDLVYADEKSPLDLYRTILRIDDARRRVFASVGGSQIILSPLGSKALALGAMMAAIERDFTIFHVESLGYTFDESKAKSVTTSDELVHIWLSGDAYGTTSAKEGTKE